MIASAAWIFAGVALWFSRGVLDVFDAAGRTTRVAMLPSVPELLGLIVLMLIIAGGVSACIRRWTSSADARAEAFLQVSLPLFGLALTILPYLPSLPDEIDPIRGLSGPIVRIIWCGVAAQVLITLLSVRALLRGLPRTEWRGRTGGAVLAGTAAVVITAALMSGALSLIRDTLTAVVLGRGGWVNIVLAAATVGLTWRWVFTFTGSTAAATLAWVSVFLTAPFFFSGISSFPEIPAAFCVVVAAIWKTAPERRSTPWLEFLIRGVALSVLPWLSVTYVPMTVVIAVVLGIRAVRDPKAALALMVPVTISLIRRFAFPALAALANDAPHFGNPVTGIAGLLFDQELGILIYAPSVALGFIGLWQMVFARDAMVRHRGRELTAMFGALLLSAGAIINWWQTLAPPGRPLVPALPLLALPIAWVYLGATERSVRRSLCQLLAVLGVTVTAAMTVAEQGALIVQDRDGSSRLLQWLTMLWPAWQVAPAVALNGLRTSAGLIALWVAAAATVAWISRRNSSQQPGVSALMATLNLSAAVMVVALLAPAISGGQPASVTEPEARARLALLDDFDSVARPHAIIYRPFTVAHADAIPPLMVLAAKPGLRTGGQPVPVLLNARYALAAGDYAVEIGGVGNTEAVQGTVGLQVGRIGAPMREWQVELAPGAGWRGEFSLPVDAEFVGFVVSDSLASARSLRITPLRIINKNNRESLFHGPSRTVLSAIEAPSAAILFHDEDVYPEKTGFWVHGESTSYMTVAAHHPDLGVTLRVHSGARANTVTFATPTWGERVALVPGTPRDVRVPPPARPGPFLLRVTTERGFVPADVIPGNSDRRILGCWVEIVQAP
ncbi:MAG TPA: hypothetical protein VL243_13445 [Vicinamibacterales bacterium]|nr:hypothetical protein [Vicinamibacterales bacterium]